LLESEYGLELPRRLQIEFSQVVQMVMDANGKELGAADLWAIFEREYGLSQAQAALQPVMTEVDDQNVRVSAQLRIAGQSVAVDGQGNGPIDAFVNGLATATGRQLRVLDYHEHAIGSGAEARAVAYIELRVDGTRTLFGVGIDANIVSASFKAIVSGMQRAALPHANDREILQAG
jgi:2-isopropylmalate synthase